MILVLPLNRKKSRATRRLSKRRWIGVLAVIALALLIAADRAGWLLVRVHDDEAHYHGRTVRVARVIDGDTIEVEMYDPLLRRERTRVRLWGIDAPELGAAGRTPAEPFAQEAYEFARGAAEGRIVRLHLEPPRLRDRYDRVLAHVELAEDDAMLNRLLLLAGLARVDEHWPHARLTHYASAERAARREGVGIWGSDE